MVKCRKTCGNCDGTNCIDSTSFNCAYYTKLNWCVRYGDTMSKYCPKSCNGCGMLTMPPLSTTVAPTTLPSSCEDDPGVACSKDLCDRVPGTYLPKCKKTCGNCDGRRCTDSTSFNCMYYASDEVGYCKQFANDMTNFCPKKCGFCDKLYYATRAPTTIAPSTTPTSNNVCVDSDQAACADVDQDQCDLYPGKYLQTCKKKCNNCDGSKCYDSPNFQCARFKPAHCQQMTGLSDNCPRLCGRCP